MKKKIVVGCISLIFMLLAISVVTAIGNETPTENNKERISPLFKLRTSQAINEERTPLRLRITNILESRIFFIPFSRIISTNPGVSTQKCKSFDCNND
jgi:hypothetical protein